MSEFLEDLGVLAIIACAGGGAIGFGAGTGIVAALSISAAYIAGKAIGVRRGKR